MLRSFDRRVFLKSSILSAGLAKVVRTVANNFQLAPASKPQRVVFAGTSVAGLTFFTGPPTAHSSETTNAPVPSTVPARPPYIKFRTFVWLVLLLVGLGVLRSAIATRLDGFTIDEAYHVAAGVSYVKYSDFRINPEHPPLVKLWVGSFIAATGFHMEPLRQFSDKPDERTFTETLVYRANDPDSVQRRARVAMYTLNGLLLIFLALAIEQAFNPVVALGALLFLVIDPTVAAHWPVVMTDLPVALLSATAIVLATRAFRGWIPRDLAFCSLFLGLALTAKHSAPVVLLAVGAVGACLALFQLPERSSGGTRWKKLAKAAAVVAGALVVLWGAYLFRFSETTTGQESFNRSLVDKINDVDTPMYHAVLTAMAATHVVPRAYLWGFADTIRAGMEGRPFPQLIFGRIYINKGPKYFFPATIAVKLPIGLSVLSLAGLFLLFTRRLPEWNFPAGIILAVVVVFFLVLMNGATYAGVRHALPVVALISVFAGMFVQHAFLSHSSIPKTIAVVGFLAAMLSAIPVMRPWEYFNEFVGTRNAYKYFGDEGVDLGQRTKELSKYYFRVLKPAGEIPEVLCFACTHELDARGVDYVGRDMQRDLERIADPVKTETIASSPQFLTYPYADLSTVSSGEPVARYGNLFIFKGTYNLPGLAAGGLYWYGIEKLYAEKPDEITAEKAFQRSVNLYPRVYFYHIELANLLLKRGARNEALHEYEQTLLYAPADRKIRQPIEAQIQRFAGDPHAKIPYLRNPFME
jgi:hypothetical protein